MEQLIKGMEDLQKMITGRSKMKTERAVTTFKKDMKDESLRKKRIPEAQGWSRVPNHSALS